ncbi:MAG: hypothetical protein JWN85_251 [Gammaproteobacteria bacterium]|nr:hypothetical protein [Gammaproteobacteria bacterium]
MLELGLSWFPGVPVFFVVSGLLVSRSYERSPSLREYYRNRALRILPGLWVCLDASVAVICIAGVATLGPISSGDWLLWWAAQMTLFQQYQPAFLHNLGTGLFNGSLWTIPVELEFYLLLPLLYAALLADGRGSTLRLCLVAAVSLAAHLAIEHPSFWPRLVTYPRVGKRHSLPLDVPCGHPDTTALGATARVVCGTSGTQLRFAQKCALWCQGSMSRTRAASSYERRRAAGSKT